MDDWQVGDLALCTGYEGDLGWTECAGPNVGAVCSVTRLSINPADDALHLGFAEWPQNCLYEATEFRRIRALSDEERNSFLADLDEPIAPARRVAPVDAALNARVGHPLSASALLATLPGPSADDTPRHADGSGLLFNRAHEVEVDHG